MKLFARIAILAMFALLASACSEDLAAEPLAGIVRTPTPNVGDLSLPRTSDHTDFTFSASGSDLLVMYFGYTSCPDVCPTTLADLSAALGQLEDGADQIEVAMATIDPVRDSDEVVGAYLQSFVPDGIGLRTEDDAALRSVANELGVNYSVKAVDGAEPEVSHTGFLYVIDQDGDLLVTWSFGMPAAEMSRDLSILLARAEA